MDSRLTALENLPSNESDQNEASSEGSLMSGESDAEDLLPPRTSSKTQKPPTTDNSSANEALPLSDGWRYTDNLIQVDDVLKTVTFEDGMFFNSKMVEVDCSARCLKYRFITHFRGLAPTKLSSAILPTRAAFE